MTDRASLSTLLSQLLIAFTIEFDNEAERRIAESGRSPRFLVSLVMWSNFMRFVGDAGVRVGDIPSLAGLSSAPVANGWMRVTLAGMQRWGYVVVDAEIRDCPKPSRRDPIVRVTPIGRRAQAVWRPLSAEIEDRWRARFGAGDIGRLRDALQRVVESLDRELPHYLPVTSYADGMRCEVRPLDELGPRRESADRMPDRDLSVLLAQVLLAFTLDFERESKVSLAISANPLRVIGDSGARVRDLPRLTGVSKEAISASLGFLERRGLCSVEPDPTAARTKVVRLTPSGQAAHARCRQRLGSVERGWAARFGATTIDSLDDALRTLIGEPGQSSRLGAGLAPPPGCWRARPPYATQTAAMVADPAGALPHHPMVLHRGGFPDGS